MRGLKCLLPVSFAMGVLGALAVAVPAFAADTASGTCQINGTAATSGVIPLIGSASGSYTFSATGPGQSPLHLRCVGTDPDSNGGVAQAGQIDATSTGTYSQAATANCGTGIADSGVGATTGTLVTPPPANDGTQDLLTALPNSSYHIVFGNSVGTLQWTSGPTGVQNQSGSSGGVILITPIPNSSPAGTCTQGFNVTGLVSGQFPSD